MQKETTKLHGDIVFGPIKSRRLGLSLGVNLSPIGRKICTFNCIYCECGFNSIENDSNTKFPSRETIKETLESKLQEMSEKQQTLDSITFSGNGEPTLHPEFGNIVNDVILLRNSYFPNAEISVLSNSTRIGKESVFKALNKVDNNILKLDAGIEALIHLIDQPVSTTFNLPDLTEELKRFNGNLTIQTMFLRGTFSGKTVDNTTEENISLWLNLLKIIQPKQVMIYSIDRATPAEGLIKIEKEELEKIGKRVKNLGISVIIA